MSWPDTVVSASAGLFGALVGAWTTWKVQRRIEDGRATERREDREAGREAQRASLAHAAAFELLDPVVTVASHAGGLVRSQRWPRELVPDEQWVDVPALLGRFRHGLLVWAPLLPVHVRERVDQLIRLIHELSSACPVDETTPGDPQGRLTPWWPWVVNRAITDVESYAEYVRRSLLAVISDSEPMPADAPYPPVLRRVDNATWRPPDQPEHSVDSDVGDGSSKF